MFLRYLHITKNGKTLRKIGFKKGVNLIVDTTPESKIKETGNNVGKTTVLRLVDYCLGSNGKDIYQGAEFKNTDTNVEQFLINNNVEISVCLISSFEGPKAKEIILKRNFLQRKQKIASINGENYPNIKKEYCNELNKLIFGIKADKPTFRQIVSRFIRNDALKMNNILKYLPVTKDTVYETIFLYMFGVKGKNELLAEKQIVDEQLKSEKNYLTKISGKQPSTTIEQVLKTLHYDIVELNDKKKKFNVSPKYQEEFEKLKLIKEKINSISLNLAERQMHLDLLQENINDLKENISTVDNDALKIMYFETKSFIPELQKKFEDAVKFHNSLIRNKLEFISKDIPAIETEIKELKESLKEKLQNEETIGRKLSNSGSLSDYDLLVEELNTKFEKKGHFEEKLEQIKSLEKSILEKTERLSEINKEIDKSEPELKDNISLFNKFFSYYSKQLYNEEFVLSHYVDKGIYKLRIDNLDANTGDGKKKVQIAAFDLAYIAFTKNIGMQSLSFEMHDRIEGIHSHQLSTLFELVNSDRFDGQYIVSVLKDKFDSDKLKCYLEENKRLELSQNDKLFRIENG
ncbi:MAG: hypothetical protein B6D64_05440 [Bacteroidetes bacterium 4484_276]|nr:MAG: hypothetical protein B6D64_05440 [Bacteroidetes bacterium 4484_276]